MSGATFSDFSEIILPPGSTSADLQTAVYGAASGDVIIISGDMPFADTVVIPAAKEITIQSDEGNNWVMAQVTSNMRHFDVSGSLVLQNITADGGNSGGGVNIRTDGNFIMNDGAIIRNCYTDSTVDYGGGGVRVTTNAVFIMNEGAVIQDCRSDNIYHGGGAVNIYSGKAIMNGGLMRGNIAQNGGAVFLEQEYEEYESTFTMTGGTISENTAQSANGGGLFGSGSDIKIYMSGGEIINNYSPFNGGGVSLFTTDFFMSGGEISGNFSNYEGGGIFLTYSSSFIMSGGKINNNTARIKGGAVSAYGASYIMTGGMIKGNQAVEYNGGALNFAVFDNNTASISGASYIMNNRAASGNGGGISLEFGNHGSLIIGDAVVFSCNSASAAYNPPNDARVLYPNIQFASTSITNHPLNNFDIEYVSGEPLEKAYHLTYNANGGSGSYFGPEIIPGNTDVVLSAETAAITREGYIFTSWNTEPDGSGESYNAGDTVTVNCSAALFAQWLENPETYAITYFGNGGRGSYTDYCREFDLFYTMLSTEQTRISRQGYMFVGWNTDPNGGGVSRMPGNIINVSANMSFYAQWKRFPDQKRQCRAVATKCRISIEGQKLWADNDNAGNTRPPAVEIILLRDGEIYERRTVSSSGDGYFGFCCLPVWKNTDDKYNYQIDEVVPAGYTKRIEGFNIINTLIQ